MLLDYHRYLSKDYVIFLKLKVGSIKPTKKIFTSKNETFHDMHELIFSRGVNGFLKVEGGGQVEMQVFSNARLLLYQKVCVLGITPLLLPFIYAPVFVNLKLYFDFRFPTRH